MKLFSFIAFLVFTIVSYGQLDKINANLYLRHFITSQADTTISIGLFVKGNLTAVKDFVEENQGIYRGSVKGWHYIRIPGVNVKKSLDDNRIHRINYRPYRGTPLNDTMRVNNRINPVHNGLFPLDTAYTGKGVIMGIIDTGTDFTHPDFQLPNGDTRLLHLWDQTLSNNAQTPGDYGYGRHWDSTAINAGQSNHTDPWGHGTTVSGAAAGNANANGTHKGVAPESWIITVESKFNAADWLATVVDATEYIYTMADAHNMPCVINASLGTYLGSHDGLDPYALYIDSLINAKPGRLMVSAAGNSGDWEKYHLHTDVNSLDTSFTWFTNNPNSAFSGPAAFWEIWTDTLDFQQVNFAIGADKVSPNFSFRGRTAFRNIQGNINTLYHDTIRNDGGDIIATVQTWAEKRDGQYLLQVYLPNPDSSDYLFRFETTGMGSYDCWSIEKYGMSKIVDTIPAVTEYSAISKYIQPDSLQSIVSSFQCLPDMITVGNYVNDSGYVNKFNNWIPKDGERGALYKSSSKGPNRLGDIKPEICASGHTTLSAAPMVRIVDWTNNGIDSVLSYGGMHMNNGGTSMASPIVAGVGALLLEKCGSLTQQEFRNAVLNNTYIDNFTGGGLPNNAWGYGKLDAFEALKSRVYTPSYSGDLYYCNGDSTQIIINNNYQSYVWLDGSTDSERYFSTTNQTGLQTIDNFGCESDTLQFNIVMEDLPTITPVGLPLEHCENDSVLASVITVGADSIIWQNGFYGSSQYLSGNQTQYVYAVDSLGCKSADSIDVVVIEHPLPPMPTISADYDSLHSNVIANVSYNWYYEGNDLGLNSSSIQVLQNGGYVVQVIDANNCMNESVEFQYNSVGLHSENFSIEIYPNPVLDNFQINASETIQNVTIYDEAGRQIKAISPNSLSTEIRTDEWARGIYHLTLLLSDNISVHKLIVKQ